MIQEETRLWTIPSKMDTTELKICLGQYGFLEKQSIGVFPADQLPKITRLPSSFIANTDDSTRDGQHWVAFHISDDKKLEYFDSYGMKPNNKYFETFIKKFRKQICNKQRLQGPLSTTCGQYALAFLFHRAQGLSLDEIVGKFSKNDLHENDHLVQDMVAYYFDFSQPVYSIRSLNQICKSLGH